jgi:pyruvate dehydrogenase E2 component (dihydrolipoamide acetyltransferase)
MPVDILMPALSPTMEKGNLAKWLKKEGDKVKPGDVIAEIETDKATMEYEAIDEGTLARIVVPAGTQDVPVNQLIAVLAEDGEDVKAAAATAGKTAAPPKAAAPAAAPSVAAAPAVPKPAPQVMAGDGSRGAQRVFSSPLARRLAKDAGIDLGRVQGSGPHGRIIARDVEAARSGRASAPPAAAQAPTPALPPAAPSDEKVRALFAPGSYELVPHDNIRKVIARRLVEAKLTIPHFYLTLDCRIGRLLAARDEINAAAPKDKDGKPAYKISVNDFVIKALALALQKVPDANVTWTEAAMLRHRHSDIGVAVSIPGGLITPVVRNAELKSLSVISSEMKDYAARARTRKLKPEEYQGGSSAVSNLGMYGIKDFAAVINPPHATILAVGAGEERAVVRDGKIAAEWMMSVTLSTDHRAVDGALGAELLGAFKTLIENPVMMVV